MKTIYYGTILTMEDEYPSVEAICVEDGVIQAVGSLADIMALKDDTTRCVDLKDQVMMPAFIDPHSHFVGVANSLSQCDLREVKSFDELVETMRKFAQERNIQPGEWIQGTGYDHNFLLEQKHPDRHILDRISTVCPIVIHHASSHMGVMNTMGLQEMGLNENTEDPEGGRYGREDDGSLSGYMEENAYISLVNKIPMITVDKLMELIREAQGIYARYGITTVQDGFVGRPLFQLLDHAAKSGLLYLDVVGYVDLEHERSLCQEHPEYVKSYQNHFKIGGYKIFLDGSPQGRTAWMSTPYQGEDEDYYGYPIVEDPHLHDLIENAMKDDMQLLAHCNGDAAAQQYLDQFQCVVREHPDLDTNRPVMIHAQLVREDQLKLMCPLHMIPSFFVAHTYYWGDIHIQNFGKKRADHISPTKSAQQLGIPFTLHQDSPVVHPDMMHTVWCAVNRLTRKGVVLGDAERISPYEALQAVTIHAAYQYFEEDRKGSIAKGKIADLVILERNPLTCDTTALADIKVMETIKEGKTVYQHS